MPRTIATTEVSYPKECPMRMSGGACRIVSGGCGESIESETCPVFCGTGILITKGERRDKRTVSEMLASH